jgi:hypothetical protein
MFELHITCSKDISKLKIDFTDGSCICTEDSKDTKDSFEPKEQKESKKSKKTKEIKETQNIEDSEDSRHSVPDWIIPDRPKKVEGQKPPEIPDLDRPPKIDEVLNNLDF